MKKILLSALFLLGALTMSAQVPTKPYLNLELAKKIAAKAEAEATKNKWNVVIAILDDGGNLVYLQKMDGTQIGSIAVAQAKGSTAIKFKRPSKVFEDGVAGGRNALLALPGATPVEGGFRLTGLWTYASGCQHSQWAVVGGMRGVEKPVVDDHLLLLAPRKDFEIIAAENAVIGIELARNQSPDLILLDWMLPSLSGIEVCRQLRRNPATRDVPIIMLTYLACFLDRSNIGNVRSWRRDDGITLADLN